MKLKTIAPVTFDTWINQVKKFTSGNTDIISTTFPVNTTEMGVAEIRVTMQKPLHEGFNAVICYIQHYTITKPELKEVYTEEGGDVQMKDVTTSHSVEIVNYNKTLTYEETNNLMIAIESQLPNTVVGLDRLKQVVIQGVLQDAVANNTFDGLLVTDYEVIA